MKNPVSIRMQIPFFHQKTEKEFRNDPYERYDEMVIRQTALHLADDFWEKYPFQPALDFAKKHLPKNQNIQVLELGCGVGRWIGELALANPEGIFWGLDYSYQMLRQANRFWIENKTIELHLSKIGLKSIKLEGHELKNLHFGLAKAEHLPFAENSQNAVVSSFLFDRLQDPIQGLKEMYRVLKQNGKMILVTPFNFQKEEFWEKFYPPVRVIDLLKKIGFDILECEEEMILEEPLDGRGNALKWKTVAIACVKNDSDII